MSLFSLPEIAAQAITGHYHVHGDLKEADCVIGFSFGYRGREGHDVTPGLSNQDLANFSLKYLADLPQILQFEIADAYAAAGGAGKVARIENHRTAGKYLDTREVAVQAKAIMDQNGWKTAAILAHPNHIPRCDAVCHKLGIDTVVIDGFKGAIEFDPLSTQKWTRDIDQWRGYEPLAASFYVLRRWM